MSTEEKQDLKQVPGLGWLSMGLSLMAVMITLAFLVIPAFGPNVLILVPPLILTLSSLIIGGLAFVFSFLPKKEPLMVAVFSILAGVLSLALWFMAYGICWKRVTPV